MRKLIGKGSFTRAYQIGENQVEVITSCPAKECYALFSQENPFAPKIERNYEKEGAYLMPLYPKFRASLLNPRAKVVYKELRRIEQDSWSLDYHAFCKKVNASLVLTEEEQEWICDLAGDVCNAIDPADMRFEISPRNVTLDENGNLVLLDCFFCVKALRKENSKKYASV